MNLVCLLDPSWITAIFTGLTTISVALIYWQVKADHDRGRRERALDLLRQWDEIRTEDSFRFERLVFELAASDVEKIEKGQPITINEELANKFFPGEQKQPNNTLVLDADTVRKIRCCMLTLLNTLENVALAYKNNVADREIINEAYYNLLINQDLLRRCRNFMDHFGCAWPALDDLPNLMKAPIKSRKPTA